MVLLSPKEKTCFSFGLRCKSWIFSVEREKSLLNCISTGIASSQQSTPLKVPAEQLGVLWLEGLNRVGWHVSGGRLQNASWEISNCKKDVQEGRWKPAKCNKNSFLPKGSPVCSMGPFGARAEGDGRLWEERDGPCMSIVTNEPCWKCCHKQRAGFAGQQEQSSAGCLLLAHRGTLWF